MACDDVAQGGGGFVGGAFLSASHSAFAVVFLSCHTIVVFDSVWGVFQNLKFRSKVSFLSSCVNYNF